ncbi:TPA: hypothetical protein ACT96X_003158 [Legionella pneumophila]|uniref:hypothetical protein n=1 Tax=Legionella pneumophila TaxID=446 RepID=UPI00078857FF|nr:hypothetical protein [Legionella pneumophila]HAU1193419.1 hypothetical protein [Legionella pneumophila]HBD7103636.1 hypothetical protein [Legionella pneumophila]HCO4740325.1 hypothetical protein [Legionella pneumophila]HDU7931094.1 hypothetical protein [Legionella pneumophila]HDU7937162.1 hypothetical protein [Legionella pneumophila]
MFDFDNTGSVLNYHINQFKTCPDNWIIIDDKTPTEFMLTYCTAAIIYNASTQQSMMIHYTPSFGPGCYAEDKSKIDVFLNAPGEKEAVIITQYTSQSTILLRERLQKEGIPTEEYISPLRPKALIIRYDPITLEINVTQGDEIKDCSFKSESIVKSKRQRDPIVFSEDFLRDKMIFDKIRVGGLDDLMKSFDDVWKLVGKFPNYLELFLDHAFKNFTESKVELLLCFKIMARFPKLSGVVLSRIEQGSIISFEPNMKHLDKIIDFIRLNPNSAHTFKSIVFDIVSTLSEIDSEKVQTCKVFFPDLNINPKTNAVITDSRYGFYSRGSEVNGDVPPNSSTQNYSH